MLRSAIRALLLSGAILAFCSGALARVKLPAFFSDNMVLQQRDNVAVWGEARPGEQVYVSGSWGRKVVKTKAGADGKWMLHLPTTSAGGPYQLTIRDDGGDSAVVLQNVMLGEVWLCSGQSNMNFPIGKAAGWRTGVEDYEKVIAEADHPNIRMFTVEQNVADTPVTDVRGQWAVCSPATAGKFSAVAYYFARELTRVTGVPVGLIHSSVGGTPAEAWTRRDILAGDTALAGILKRYDSLVAAHPDSVKKYKYNPQSPAKLYNGMIHPLIPYTIKGVIWYQGESNSDRPYQYRRLFTALIGSWRKEWNGTLPFYFVQIAPFKDKPPQLREAQLLTYQSVPRTGMVVITDAGDSLNIHPRNKEVVGRRLALWALAKDYGQKKSVFSGPLYREMRIEGNRIRIAFDFTADGLVVKVDTLAANKEAAPSLREFMIAGADRHFVPANVRIEGKELVVWNDQVEKPVAVRFAWKPFPHPNLYNTAGLPASPFRTDEW